MDSIQKTDKTQDSHEISRIECQNRGYHQLNKIKVEEQSKSSCAHPFKNGDHHKDENLGITHEEMVDKKDISTTTTNDGREEIEMEEENGRERLKRHRSEVAGHVWIPDMWGQEEFLKDWSDCSAFDACMVPQGILLARSSLIKEGRRSHSGSLRVENS